MTDPHLTAADVMRDEQKTGSACWLVERTTQYNVECQRCGTWDFVWSDDMGPTSSLKEAQKAMRRRGWGTRRGSWVCDGCLAEEDNARALEGGGG